LIDKLPLVGSAHSVSDSLELLGIIASELDKWKTIVDEKALFTKTSAPGVQSLHLTFLGARLMVVRSAWDCAGQNSTPFSQAAHQEACLQTCEEIVDFVCDLSGESLSGYWSSRG
jgi:hypothetical protein